MYPELLPDSAQVGGRVVAVSVGPPVGLPVRGCRECDLVGVLRVGGECLRTPVLDLGSALELVKQPV